jgi:hypothetical protein
MIDMRQIAIKLSEKFNPYGKPITFRVLPEGGMLVRLGKRKLWFNSIEVKRMERMK